MARTYQSVIAASVAGLICSVASPSIAADFFGATSGASATFDRGSATGGAWSTPGQQTGPIHAENSAYVEYHSLATPTVTSVAQAKSYADLATGKLGAEASRSDRYGFSQTGAGWHDTLTFNAPAGSNVWIDFALNVEGDVSPNFGGSTLNSAAYNLILQPINGVGNSPYLFNAQGTIRPTGFSPTILTQPAAFEVTRFDATGVAGRFQLLAGYFYTIRASLSASDGADFYHTAAFDFGPLPDGVTLTSASGHFLEAAGAGVPEPATWALALVGFGAAGISLRRRRPRAAA